MSNEFNSKDAPPLSKNDLAHIKLFKVAPLVIGMYWNNPQKVQEGIGKAIAVGVPYNEYDMLSEDGKKAFDSGEMKF